MFSTKFYLQSVSGFYYIYFKTIENNKKLHASAWVYGLNKNKMASNMWRIIKEKLLLKKYILKMVECIYTVGSKDIHKVLRKAL